MSENDWKWIDNYENMYRIYKDGRVESVRRKGVRNNRFLKPYINEKTGYKQIVLSKDNELETFLVHRLIAIAFIENPNLDLFDWVDHRDGDTLNNSIKNLRWITASGNCMNKKSRGSSKYLGVNWNKASNKWVARISIDGKRKFLGYFDDEEEAHKAYLEKYNEVMKQFEKL